MARRGFSASEIVRDLRDDETDEFLMKKYDLSEDGLKKVFQELVETGLMTQEERALIAAASDKSMTVTAEHVRRSRH